MESPGSGVYSTPLPRPPAGSSLFCFVRDHGQSHLGFDDADIGRTQTNLVAGIDHGTGSDGGGVLQIARRDIGRVSYRRVEAPGGVGFERLEPAGRVEVAGCVVSERVDPAGCVVATRGVGGELISPNDRVGW